MGGARVPINHLNFPQVKSLERFIFSSCFESFGGVGGAARSRGQRERLANGFRHIFFPPLLFFPSVKISITICNSVIFSLEVLLHYFLFSIRRTKSLCCIFFDAPRRGILDERVTLKQVISSLFLKYEKWQLWPELRPGS